MTVVTDVNWQAEYLGQINARLTGLERGQEQLRTELRGEIRQVRDDLCGEIREVRDELRGEIREVRNLVVGLFAFVVTAVLGAVVKTLL